MPQPYSFKEIYRTHYEKIFRLCKGYTAGDTTAAEDLTQDAFIKVYTHLKTFKGEASLSTWIYRIAVNTCLLYIRETKKKLTFPLSFDVAQDSNNDALEKEKQLQLLYGCIDKLRGDDKALIILTLEKLPQKEIATILGITHEAVRIKMHRVKKQLTKCTQHEHI